MKILLGTTNPSKFKRLSDLLAGFDVELFTPSDMNITDEPLEQGATPTENAILKAKFYGKYCDAVICHDSGLYFDELELSDPRQPALHIRTPMGKPRLNDEEMIDYYSQLISTLGGKVTACYLEGFAVYRNGVVTSFASQREDRDPFYMVDVVSPKRHSGWPLDSLSMYKNTDNYFVDVPRFQSKNSAVMERFNKKLIAFFQKTLQF